MEVKQVFSNIITLRIHYPLPLEYCGLPDPTILQATIRRLHGEIERLNATGVNKNLQKQIDKLLVTNQKLFEENRKLSNGGIYKGLITLYIHLIPFVIILDYFMTQEKICGD